MNRNRKSVKYAPQAFGGNQILASLAGIILLPEQSIIKQIAARVEEQEQEPRTVANFLHTWETTTAGESMLQFTNLPLSLTVSS